MKKWLQVVVAVTAATVMQSAVCDEVTGQAEEQPVHVTGEKLDSGLGTMVYGESLDDGLCTMVYGESLDSGLGELSALDIQQYFPRAAQATDARPEQAQLSN